MTLKSGAKYHLAGTDRVTGEEEPGRVKWVSLGAPELESNLVQLG